MAIVKERQEMSDQYKWDIEIMYQPSSKWEEAFLAVESLLNELAPFNGKILDSADSLFKTLSLSLEVARLIENVYTYAKMKQDEDSRVSENQAMTSKAEALSVKIGEMTAFIKPEILAADPSVIKGFVESHEGLKGYEQMIDDLLRRKPHTLSANEEQLLAMAGDLSTVPSNVFEMLNSADLKFPTIKGADGQDLTLTHGNFIPTMESTNRSVRESAYNAYYSVYQGHINTMATLVQSEVKKNIFFSKAKKFNTAREAALFENNVPVSVYDNLITAVNENLEPMHKYMAIRKRVLGVDTLKMYDLYTPIISSVDMKFSYEEAKKEVLESLKPLGAKYVSVVEKAFEDKWIDVYENTGKRSGAYSWGTYDSKPYILLNYHETVDNMFTLTHEMGHSMHSYLTHEKQPYVYGNYSIFLAEVASTTNEALLNHYMLSKVTDKQEKLYLLNHYLDQFRTTVYRQAMFAEFERDIHAYVESGEALTADILKEKYKALNVKYYGPEMEVDDTIALEWARIPHFYYNFYVFQYSTGFAAAVALSQAIVTEGQPAVDKYMDFLSAGCHKYPTEILKAAGADMVSGTPVAECLKLFGKLVDEFDALLK